MESPYSLKNKVAVITGGGSGIGLGIAQCMALADAKVILVGRNPHKLKTAANSIRGAVDVIAHDITLLNEMPAFTSHIKEHFGNVDILVNNAGNHFKKPVQETDDEAFQSVMQTHVNASFALSREFGQEMIERESGHILFIASMASFMGVPQVCAYSAAKAAQLGLVRSLAAEFSPYGVRVNGIAPGWIHSDMMHNALEKDPERKKKILSRTPMQKFGEVENIGWAAVYLSSPAAAFITGVCLPVDGGALTGF